MKTKIMTLFAVCFTALSVNLNAQTLPGEIAGQITDSVGNPVPFAAISYMVHGSLQGATADENGRFRIKPLDAGIYEVSYYYMGYNKATYSIPVNSGQITALSVKLSSSGGVVLPDVPIIYFRDFFDKDVTIVGGVFDSEIVEKSMAREPADFVSMVPAVSQRDDGQDINVRGSRSDATQYYVDGIKMIGGFSIPKASIKEVRVITGGVPAMFGDATGGIVLITTKSYWDNERK